MLRPSLQVSDGETPETCTGGMPQDHDLEPDRWEHTHTLTRTRRELGSFVQ
jgi:hypothetical protein